MIPLEHDWIFKHAIDHNLFLCHLLLCTLVVNVINFMIVKVKWVFNWAYFMIQHIDV